MNLNIESEDNSFNEENFQEIGNLDELVNKGIILPSTAENVKISKSIIEKKIFISPRKNNKKIKFTNKNSRIFIKNSQFIRNGKTRNNKSFLSKRKRNNKIKI